MLNWLEPFNIFCLLDNQQYNLPGSGYEYLAAAGVRSSVSSEDLNSLDSFLSAHPGNWIFGHLSYDLTASFYHLPRKADSIGFPLSHFFVPRHLIYIREGNLFIQDENPEAVWHSIQQQPDVIKDSPPVLVHSALPHQDYVAIIKSLQQHILRGDCYEINFCMDFFAENAETEPAGLFALLMEVSPNPFSAFYRCHDAYLLCASPERYLKKEGDQILSQPIKGTEKRYPANPQQDRAAAAALVSSAKERAENVMIVDLVRNDLSRFCERSSVAVQELFGIQSFPQVHQMVSTVTGALKKETSFSEIIRATFPMGSMTGAPKHRVVQLIDEYETAARGLFSGAVGYFDPNGDFDFNVVIRSMMYNSNRKLLNYKVGSGITFYSDPEKEWEECLLKAEGIKKVLTGRSALNKHNSNF